jgi:Ca2+/Na+ antiporter
LLFNEKNITSVLAMIFLLLLPGFLWLQLASFSGSLPGHLLGILGTLVMGYTLVYPFRKRVLGKKGKKNPLRYHIYAGLIGPCLVIVHSGHAYASWNGTLAFLAMVTIVLSGLVGRYLLRKINRSVKYQKQGIDKLRSELGERKSQIDEQACAQILALNGSHGDEDEENASDPLVQKRCDELVTLAHSIVETEYALQGLSKTKSLFEKWRTVHIYLTAFLFAVILVHALSSIYYGLRWLP